MADTQPSPSALIDLLQNRLSHSDTRDIAGAYAERSKEGVNLYDRIVGQAGTDNASTALVMTAVQHDTLTVLVDVIGERRKDLADAISALPQVTPQHAKEQIQRMNVTTAGGAYIAGGVNNSGGTNIYGGSVTIYQGVAAQTSNDSPHHENTAPTPIFSVPQRRNPTFTGRADTLDALHTALNAIGGGFVALCGLGGVGKSHIATEYAYRNLDSYRLIWWLRAESPETLAGDFASLATALELPEKDLRDQGRIIAAVKAWLATHDTWLLIFDNAERAHDLDAYLPSPQRGHIIVTSRNPAWGTYGTTIAVNPLSDELAVQYLLRRTGQSDTAHALELTHELGNLPLALEQATAYIEESSQSFAGYIHLLRTDEAALFAHKADAQPATSATIATLWNVSLHQLSDQSMTLLSLCAFLSPDDIRLSILHAGAMNGLLHLLTIVGDPLELDAAIGGLRRYSLVERTGDSLRLHRLVQAAVRGRMSEDERTRWASMALRAVDAAFPDATDARYWPYIANVLPHALFITAYAERKHINPQTTAHLLSQTGIYLACRAENTTARAVLERALRLDRAANGPDQTAVAEDLGNLSLVLQNMGEFPTAKVLMESIKDTFMQTLGPDDRTTASSLNNLGVILYQMNDLKQARIYIEQALATRRKVLGPTHPDTAGSLESRGLIEHAEKKLADAQHTFEEALQIYDDAYGPGNIESARIHHSLGLVLRDAGNIPAATTQATQAAHIWATYFGPTHPMTGRALTLLAQLNDMAPPNAQ